MLRLKDICSGYGKSQVLRDVSLHVKRGQIVSIIGANGAGKSTLLKTISSVIPCMDGQILFKDKDITKSAPHNVVRMGIIQVPEGRQIIGELSVRENLLLGCFVKHINLGRAGRQRLLDYVCDLFPILVARMDQIAGTLSGGEQQMLAIGRALMGEPQLLLTDEPSLGLAPKVVDIVSNVLLELNKSGITVLLVEQNAMIALEMAQWAFVLEGGRIVLQGSGNDLLEDENVKKSYLGI